MRRLKDKWNPRSISRRDEDKVGGITETTGVGARNREVCDGSQDRSGLGLGGAV